MPNFIDANFSSPLDLLRTPRAAAKLVRLGAFRRLGPEVKRRFKDPRLHRVFSFQAMYAGLSPDQALALYAVITYMYTILGVWFPEGGMHSVPRGLAAAATDAGAEVVYNTSVEQVVVDRDRRVSGVLLRDGSTVSADAVVMSVDLPVAYEHLLPVKARRRVRNGRYSPSAMVWHLGVEGEIGEDTGHHNIHFGEAWEDAFTDLLDRGVPMRDPSRFVSVPTLDDADAAPAGHHTLYVLEPVPNLHVGTIDWEQQTPVLTDRMLTFLTGAGYPTATIRTQHVVNPLDWQAQGMAAGTPFALAHTFGQSGPFRPKNVDKRVPGLVFAGSGTTPGVGIPMVLISGKLAAQRVAEMWA